MQVTLPFISYWSRYNSHCTFDFILQQVQQSLYLSFHTAAGTTITVPFISYCSRSMQVTLPFISYWSRYNSHCTFDFILQQVQQSLYLSFHTAAVATVTVRSMYNNHCTFHFILQQVQQSLYLSFHSAAGATVTVPLISYCSRYNNHCTFHFILQQVHCTFHSAAGATVTVPLISYCSRYNNHCTFHFILQQVYNNHCTFHFILQQVQKSLYLSFHTAADTPAWHRSAAATGCHRWWVACQWKSPPLVDAHSLKVGCKSNVC